MGLLLVDNQATTGVEGVLDCRRKSWKHRVVMVIGLATVDSNTRLRVGNAYEIDCTRVTASFRTYTTEPIHELYAHLISDKSAADGSHNNFATSQPIMVFVIMSIALLWLSHWPVHCVSRVWHPMCGGYWRSPGICSWIRYYRTIQIRPARMTLRCWGTMFIMT